MIGFFNNHFIQGLVLLVLLNLACQTNVTKFMNEPKNTHYELEKVSFDVPANFEDITVYSFAKSEEEILEVSGGERIAPLDEIEKEIDTQMVEGLGFVSAAKKDVEMDGKPARWLSYEAQERGKFFYQHFVIAVSNSGFPLWGTYNNLTIKYLSASEKSFATLEHIIKSVKGGRKTSRAETTPGFVRRNAGEINLDVPAEFKGGGYKFKVGQGKMIVNDDITFEIYEESARQPPLADNSFNEEMEKDLNKDTESGQEVAGKQTAPVSTSTLNGVILSYTLIEDKPWLAKPKQTIMRRAYLVSGNQSQLRINGCGGAGEMQNGQMSEALQKIIGSITEK
jgi:hypothetical protein